VLDDARADAPVRVLVVDDRADDAQVLATVLAQPSYEVVTAHSGHEALKCVLESDFAVILLDVVMPGMDGFEVASVIKQRERSRSTPIIFLTAAGQDVSIIYRAYSVGAVDYLAKPLDTAIVRAKVGIFAELFRKDRRIREQNERLREADRRERELELTELRLLSEGRYRSLLEMIPASVWTADSDGVASYCNHRWRSFTGLRLDAPVARNWVDAVDPADAERAASEWAAARAGGNDYTTELRLRRQGGAARWHLGQVVADRDRAGAVRAWVGMFTDCEDLKRAVEARDEFMSIASHELRTPLSTLMLQLEMFQRTFARQGVDDATARRLESARRQTERLDRLVGDLLDVSRISAGRLALEREDVDLAELVRACVERMTEQATRAGSPVECRVAGGVRARCDRARVEQVITNLVSNAVKYGAGRPIVVDVAGETAHAIIRVRDQGIGIEPRAMPRIFERFERAVSGRKYGGLGIGLYITRQIVEAHGGSIDVTSQLGEGSEFTVRLPHQARAGAHDVQSEELPPARRREA
jgi:PAS domain S-box-containing protein